MAEQRFFPDVNGEAVEAYIYDESVLHPNKSKDEKEKVFEKRTYITIRIKGKSDVMTRPLQKKDIERFPDAWRYYQGENVIIAKGTPVTEIEGIEIGVVAALKSRGIHYAEDLAKLEPEMVHGIRFGVAGLIEKARKMTGITAPEKAVAKVKEENELLAQRVDGLEAKMDQILAALMNAKPIRQDDDGNEEQPKQRRKRKVAE